MGEIKIEITWDDPDDDYADTDDDIIIEDFLGSVISNQFGLRMISAKVTCKPVKKEG